MARKRDIDVAAGDGRIDVDEAAFEGLDVDQLRARASQLRAIRHAHGDSVMYGVASGLSVDRARELGSTYRPTIDR